MTYRPLWVDLASFVAHHSNIRISRESITSQYDDGEFRFGFERTSRVLEKHIDVGLDLMLDLSCSSER